MVFPFFRGWGNKEFFFSSFKSMEELAKSWSCLTLSDVEGSHVSITEGEAVLDFVLAAL